MAAAKSNLGAIYRSAGRLAEAMGLHTETLKARQDVFGSDHPETLRSQFAIADTYMALGDADNALQWAEASLGDRTRVLGPDHPHTRSSQDLVTKLRSFVSQ